MPLIVISNASRRSSSSSTGTPSTRNRRNSSVKKEKQRVREKVRIKGVTYRYSRRGTQVTHPIKITHNHITQIVVDGYYSHCHSFMNEIKYKNVDPLIHTHR